MAHYKVTFHTRPNIELYPDNPPIVTSPYYVESPEIPDKQKLNYWYYENIGGANSYKVIDIDCVSVSEQEYSKVHFSKLIEL